MFAKSAIILAAANLAAAHTTFQSFVINGKNMGQHFAVQTPSNGNNPILDVTSTAMICNGGKATSDEVEVAAGSKVGMQWHHNDPSSAGDGDDPIAPSHKGPVMVYIAKADSKGEGAVWTKIYEDGLSGGKWGVENFIANKGLIEVSLPNLEPGSYLIRPEVIGLHEAAAEKKAQFYNGCGQIKVTGSGSVALPATGVDMTKAYKATDPGVKFDIYSGKTDYTIPGPKSFTIDQFISWLKSTTSSKTRRHARAFNL
ncbi:Glycoside hydrolase family 61 protein [Pyrenophora tritici-repentis]|nr:Glycoside hydrolase family 61 protein [Pyrenophora tritici-repentis]